MKINLINKKKENIIPQAVPPEYIELGSIGLFVFIPILLFVAILIVILISIIYK